VAIARPSAAPSFYLGIRNIAWNRVVINVVERKRVRHNRPKAAIRDFQGIYAKWHELMRLRLI